jgi:DNA-binding transcriptional regulator GbsR (MarR family)
MKKKIDKITDKLLDLQEELEQMAQDAQDVFDNRTERWQESEKGEEYQEMISALEDAANSVQDAYDYLSDFVE